MFGGMGRITAPYGDTTTALEVVEGIDLGGRRAVVTGNPVRPAVLHGNPAKGLAAYGLDPAVPLVLVTGGASGGHAGGDEPDGARAARTHHEQGGHDRDQKSHGRSLFVGTFLTPSTQSALREIRPLLRVDLGHDDPFLHRPIPLARVEGLVVNETGQATQNVQLTLTSAAQAAPVKNNTAIATRTTKRRHHLRRPLM